MKSFLLCTTRTSQLYRNYLFVKREIKNKLLLQNLLKLLKNPNSPKEYKASTKLFCIQTSIS